METANTKSAFGSISLKGAVLLAVGLLLVGWLLNTPEGLLGKADAVGYAVCHRIDVRSFHLGERQLPLCARCSGMFLGAGLGLIYQTAIAGRRAGLPSRGILLLLGLLVVAFAVDGLNSYLTLFPSLPHGYEPNNTLRLLTGTGMGLAISAVLLPSFRQTIWREWDGRPMLGDRRSLLGLLLLAGVLVLALLTENPLILYPLALASAAGVLALLTLVYTMIWLMIFRLENRCLSIGSCWLPLVVGFGTGLAQIAALDFVRFLLTGTWDGFHIG